MQKHDCVQRWHIVSAVFPCSQMQWSMQVVRLLRFVGAQRSAKPSKTHNHCVLQGGAVGRAADRGLVQPVQCFLAHICDDHCNQSHSCTLLTLSDQHHQCALLCPAGWSRRVGG
jgi:hypothetical protein